MLNNITPVQPLTGQYGRSMSRVIRKSIPFPELVCSASEIRFSLLVKPVEIAEHLFIRISVLCARNAERRF